MMPAVERAGFQFKNGAAFVRGDEYGDFDFGDKFTPGRDSTFQVQRATFDKLLADEAEKQGVEIRYEVARDGCRYEPAPSRACTRGGSGGRRIRRSRREFILDASGFGRTLPKLLDLETPSTFPGAQRRVHARRRSHPGRRLRSQQDPGRRPPAASRRVVLADSVPARALLARLRRAARSSLRRYPAQPEAASAQAGERGAVPRARCWRTQSGTRRRASCPATPPT